MQPAYPRLLIMSTLRRHLWACCINKDRFYLNHWFGHCVWLSCDERGYCKNMTRVSFLRYNCSMKLTVRNWWLSAFDGRQPLPQVRSPAFLCLRNVVVWGLKKTPPQYWGCLSSTVLFRIHLACWDGPALIFLGAPLDLSGNSVQKHAGVTVLTAWFSMQILVNSVVNGWIPLFSDIQQEPMGINDGFSIHGGEGAMITCTFPAGLHFEWSPNSSNVSFFWTRIPSFVSSNLTLAGWKIPTMEVCTWDNHRTFYARFSSWITGGFWRVLLVHLLIYSESVSYMDLWNLHQSV
jgi:hypothetical protein